MANAKVTQLLNETAMTVINLMETEGVNWSKPWVNTTRKNGQPISIYKREYSGINRWILGMKMSLNDWQSPVFATFKKWKEVGATIKKGEKATSVFLFKNFVKKIENDQGEEEEILLRKSDTFPVFNADQVEGWNGNWLEPEEEIELSKDWNDVELADLIVNNTGATIHYKDQDHAFYSPSSDVIVMPTKEQFKDQNGYYGTMFHELIHWTGSDSRLARTFGKRFGDKKYACEELVAELGAAMLSGIARVDATPRADHAKYLNTWIKGLKDSPSLLMKAASKAEEASQYIIEQSSNNNDKVRQLVMDLVAA